MQVQSLLPTNTNQINQPNNHRASLALKSILIIAGNDMSVPIGLDLSCKSTSPDFDQFSPSASGTIVSTRVVMWWAFWALLSLKIEQRTKSSNLSFGEDFTSSHSPKLPKTQKESLRSRHVQWVSIAISRYWSSTSFELPQCLTWDYIASHIYQVKS